MKRATFSAGNSFPNGRRRSLVKPAIWMFSLCSLLLSGAAISDKLLGGEGGGGLLGGMLSPESATAGPLSELLGGGGETGTKPSTVLITPTGDLTPEQRAWLLEQARRGAPIPLDKSGAPVDAESSRAAQLGKITEALAEQGG